MKTNQRGDGLAPEEVGRLYSTIMQMSIKTTFPILGDHITLGQLLKALNVIGSGGEARMFLLGSDVKVNGDVERQRGRKLRPGDSVGLPDGRIVTLE